MFFVLGAPNEKILRLDIILTAAALIWVKIFLLQLKGIVWAVFFNIVLLYLMSGVNNMLMVGRGHGYAVRVRIPDPNVRRLFVLLAAL